MIIISIILFFVIVSILAEWFRRHSEPMPHIRMMTEWEISVIKLKEGSNKMVTSMREFGVSLTQITPAFQKLSDVLNKRITNE